MSPIITATYKNNLPTLHTLNGFALVLWFPTKINIKYISYLKNSMFTATKGYNRRSLQSLEMRDSKNICTPSPPTSKM
jgi:hypothetical protein